MKTQEIFKADIYKLNIGDIIVWQGKIHNIESINKDTQGVIKSITTDSHHLQGYNIYTSDKNKQIQ